MKKLIFAGFVLCSAVIFLLPQQVNAQVSSDTARLLGNAGIQVIKQTDPVDFTLTLLNGESAALSSCKGKVVLLNFWATWCPPCREEMPSMENLYKRFNGQGLEILAVNLRETAGAVQKFIKSNGYTFPVMLDSDGKIGGIYGVRGIPTTFIIDREGKIIGKVGGSIYWDTPQVFAAIESLLK